VIEIYLRGRNKLNTLAEKNEIKNRRRRMRKRVNLFGYSNLPSRNGEVSVTIDDITLDGMSISLNVLVSAFRVGDKIDVRFDIVAKREISVTAVIRNIRNNKQFGLEFVGLRDYSKEKKAIGFMVGVVK
jgi:hypothetical protein